MSGHSKWATIKRQKAVNDNARGKVFSKFSRAITVAAKTGGPNPDTNYRLRIAIDAAKAENMPKDTIDRAVNKADTDGSQVIEATYEGFGTGGVAVIVQAATDNKNRTAQEIKNIFDKNGGSMGQQGSVSFNFDLKGFLLVAKDSDPDSQTLALIDLGIDEIEESDDGVEVYVAAQDLFDTKNKIEEKGYKVISAELLQKPKVKVPVDNASNAKRLLSMIESFEDLDDVQKVFDNADISDEILEEVNS